MDNSAIPQAQSLDVSHYPGESSRKAGGQCGGINSYILCLLIFRQVRFSRDRGLTYSIRAVRLAAVLI
jgi:hypothetical protein